MQLNILLSCRWTKYRWTVVGTLFKSLVKNPSTAVSFNLLPVVLTRSTCNYHEIDNAYFLSAKCGNWCCILGLITLVGELTSGHNGITESRYRTTHYLHYGQCDYFCSPFPPKLSDLSPTSIIYAWQNIAWILGASASSKNIRLLGQRGDVVTLTKPSSFENNCTFLCGLI